MPEGPGGRPFVIPSVPMARPSRSAAPRALPALLSLVAPLAALLLGCWGEPPAPPPQHALVLVGLDGFRADYLDSLPAPNLSALAARGVRAERDRKSVV